MLGSALIGALPGAGSRAHSVKAQRAQLRCSSSFGDFNSYQQRWNDQQGSNDSIDQEWEVNLASNALCNRHMSAAMGFISQLLTGTIATLLLSAPRPLPCTGGVRRLVLWVYVPKFVLFCRL